MVSSSPAVRVGDRAISRWVTVCSPPPLQAVDHMNGKEVSEQLLYVGRAQKRAERQNELKRRFEQMKQERQNRYQVRWRLQGLSGGWGGWLRGC